MKVALSDLTDSQAARLLDSHGAEVSETKAGVSDQLRSLVKALRPLTPEPEIDLFEFDIHADHDFIQPPVKKAKVGRSADLPSGSKSAHDLYRTKNGIAPATQPPASRGEFRFWLLPPELKEKILFYLNTKEMLRLSATTTETRKTILRDMAQIEQVDYGATVQAGCTQLAQKGGKRVRMLVRGFFSFLSILSPTLEVLYVNELILHVAAIEEYDFPLLPNLQSVRLSVCSPAAASYLEAISENTPSVTAVYIRKVNRGCMSKPQSLSGALSHLKWNKNDIEKLAVVNFGTVTGDGCLSKIQRYLNLTALDIRRSYINPDSRLILARHSAPLRTQILWDNPPEINPVPMNLSNAYFTGNIDHLCLSLGSYCHWDATTIRDLSNLQFLEVAVAAPSTRVFKELPIMISLTHLHLTDWEGGAYTLHDTIGDMSDGLVKLFSSGSRFTHVGLANMQGVDDSVIEALITNQKKLQALVVAGRPKGDYMRVTEKSFAEVAGLTSLELFIWLDTFSTSKVTGDFIDELDPETHPNLGFVGVYVSRPTSLTTHVQERFGGRAIFSTNRLRHDQQRAELYNLAVSARAEFACCASLVKNDHGHRAIEPMW